MIKSILKVKFDIDRLGWSDNIEINKTEKQKLSKKDISKIANSSQKVKELANKWTDPKADEILKQLHNIEESDLNKFISSLSKEEQKIFEKWWLTWLMEHYLLNEQKSKLDQK